MVISRVPNDKFLPRVLSDSVLSKILYDRVFSRVHSDKIYCRVLSDSALSEVLCDSVLSTSLVYSVTGFFLVPWVLHSLICSSTFFFRYVEVMLIIFEISVQLLAKCLIFDINGEENVQLTTSVITN